MYATCKVDNHINFPNLLCTSSFINHNEPKYYIHYRVHESFKNLMAVFISTLINFYFFTCVNDLSAAMAM